MSILPTQLPEKADMSDRICRMAEPGDRDLYARDPKVSGLVFRVTKAGRKLWLLRYTAKVEGEWKDRKTTLGDFESGVTTKAARDAAEAMRARIRKGDDPQDEKLAQKTQEANARQLAEQERLTRVTMGDMLELWLRLGVLKKRKDKGEWAASIIRNHVLSEFADLEVKRFGVTEFNKVRDPLIEANTNRIANVVRNLTQQMLDFAIEREIITENPLSKIKKLPENGERDRVMCAYEDPDTQQNHPDELVTLFGKLPDSGLSETTQIALCLCLATCCRIGELIHARWAEVDLESGEWLIPKENSKNGKPHLVNLSAYAVSLLERLHAFNGDTEWLYPSRRVDGHIDPKTVTKQVKDRQRAEGEKLTGRSKKHDALLLPRGAWTPHDLRRTGATIMASLGVADSIVEKCLNHTDDNRMKRVYNRHNPRSAMAEAWRLLGAELERLESQS